jgi:hypothetical protein
MGQSTLDERSRTAINADRGRAPTCIFRGGVESCYYVPEQDWELLDYKPDGSFEEQYSDASCPRLAPKVVTCMPAEKASYTCTSPTVV